MTLRGLLLVVLSLSFMGCSSYFKRKECKKTNWFQHGYDRAMSGKRLEGDPHLAACEKVEAEIGYAEADRGFKAGMANYCKPEVAYQTGRKGDFFSESLCDGHNMRVLKIKHAEGVEALCQAKNGKDKGATGWKYNGICPKNFEAKFLSTYRVGRKIFLNGVIEQKNSEITSLDQKIRDKQLERSQVQGQLMSLGSSSMVVKERHYDARTGTYSEKSSVQENEDLKRRREDLQYRLRNLDREVKTARNQQGELRKEIAKIRAEIKAL